MQSGPRYLITTRVVLPMPVAPWVGESVDLAVERVDVVNVIEGGPASPQRADRIDIAHANAPADEAYRRAGAVRSLRVQRGLPDDAVLWCDYALDPAQAWTCVERVGGLLTEGDS